MAAYNHRGEGLRPPTEAEVTVKAIQYWGEIRDEETIYYGKDSTN
jgi:hypothetical protein